MYLVKKPASSLYLAFLWEIIQRHAALHFRL